MLISEFPNVDIQVVNYLYKLFTKGDRLLLFKSTFSLNIKCQKFRRTLEFIFYQD